MVVLEWSQPFWFVGKLVFRVHISTWGPIQLYLGWLDAHQAVTIAFKLVTLLVLNLHPILIAPVRSQ